MCQRCIEFDRDLHEQIENHNNNCEREGCIIPTREPHESVFCHLMRAHWRMAETMERIKNTRKVVYTPDLVPSQLLGDWEHHMIEAAELLARARKRREADEAQTYLQAMARVEPKGQPS